MGITWNGTFGHVSTGNTQIILRISAGWSEHSGFTLISYALNHKILRRAVVSYWRKYVHEVLVNRLGGLSLPRKSVVRLTDRPDMTLDVYRGRKKKQSIKAKNHKIKD